MDYFVGSCVCGQAPFCDMRMCDGTCCPRQSIETLVLASHNRGMVLASRHTSAACSHLDIVNDTSHWPATLSTPSCAAAHRAMRYPTARTCCDAIQQGCQTAAFLWLGTLWPAKVFMPHRLCREVVFPCVHSHF